MYIVFTLGIIGCAMIFLMGELVKRALKWMIEKFSEESEVREQV